MLEKNKIFFYDLEYALFYELDLDTIHEYTTTGHKSKIFLKKLDYYFQSYFKLRYELNDLTVSFYKNTNYYLWYFISLINDTVKTDDNYIKDMDSFRIVTFLQRKRKMNIVIKLDGRIQMSVTSGTAAKKLEMKKKKDRKSIKLSSIMIKNAYTYLSTNNLLSKCVIQFKGTENILYLYNRVILKLNLKLKEVYFIFTPFLTTKFKYKKVRSLKKNFRKKFFKAI